MICPNCGKPYFGEKFCSNCGYMLQDADLKNTDGKPQWYGDDLENDGMMIADGGKRTFSRGIVVIAIIVFLLVGSAIAFAAIYYLKDMFGGSGSSAVIYPAGGNPTREAVEHKSEITTEEILEETTKDTTEQTTEDAATSAEIETTSSALPKPRVESQEETEEPKESQTEVSAVRTEVFSMDHVTSVYASSCLSEYDMTHKASYATDYDRSTAWVEGVSGDGIGEYIQLDFDASYEITSMDICAGYFKKSDLYDKNNRIQAVVLEFDDGTEYIEIPDRMESYHVEFAAHVSDHVRVIIDRIYSGYKYQDTCLSEVSFH